MDSMMGAAVSCIGIKKYNCHYMLSKIKQVRNTCNVCCCGGLAFEIPLTLLNPSKNTTDREQD